MKNNKDNKSNDNKEIIAALGMFGKLGITMAVCVAVGVFLGKYLDIWLGTSPVLLIICSLLGAGAAIKTLYDTAMGGNEK